MGRLSCEGARGPPQVRAVGLRQLVVLAGGIRDGAGRGVDQQRRQQAQHSGAGDAEPNGQLIACTVIGRDNDNQPTPSTVDRTARFAAPNKSIHRGNNWGASQIGMSKSLDLRDVGPARMLDRNFSGKSGEQKESKRASEVNRILVLSRERSAEGPTTLLTDRYTDGDGGHITHHGADSSEAGDVAALQCKQCLKSCGTAARTDLRALNRRAAQDHACAATKRLSWLNRLCENAWVVSKSAAGSCCMPSSRHRSRTMRPTARVTVTC